MSFVTMTSATTTAWTTSTTVAPWYAWNQPYVTGTASGSSVWADWNSHWTTTTTTTNGVWVSWATPVYSINDLDAYRLSPAQSEARRAQRTEDEWTSIRARQEARRIDREADAVHAAARAEAHKLLAMVLTPGQLASYAANQYFDVVGSEGGVFRIHHGTSGNIRQVVDGREVNRLCVHPRLWDDSGGYLPTEDCLAAQALALMHDETGAVSLANVHQGQRHLRAA